MQAAADTRDGYFRRRDTDNMWKNWWTALAEGLLDALGTPERERGPYRGHGPTKFHNIGRRMIPEAIDEGEGRHGDTFPTPGGNIHDANGDSCAAAAARRMNALGTLAGRQVRQHRLNWCRAGLPCCACWRQHTSKSGQESSRPKNGGRRQRRSGNRSRIRNEVSAEHTPSSGTAEPNPSASLPSPTAASPHNPVKVGNIVQGAWRPEYHGQKEA